MTLTPPRTLVLIPARYASTRFPGKPLAKIAGIPMIQRVMENLSRPQNDVQTYVVTDNQEIADLLGKKALRVDDEVISGSERIYLAYKRFFKDQDFDFIVNVQGDEPLIEWETIENLTKFHQNSSYDVTTLVKKHSDKENFQNSNIVKVAKETQGDCHYFSRASIPFGAQEWFQHIGIYCYRPSALESFAQAKPSQLELTEKLEQLRGLEIGLRYGALETKAEFIGVDSPEDIKRVEALLNEKQIK